MQHYKNIKIRAEKIILTAGNIFEAEAELIGVNVYDFLSEIKEEVLFDYLRDTYSAEELKEHLPLEE